MRMTRLSVCLGLGLFVLRLARVVLPFLLGLVSQLPPSVSSWRAVQTLLHLMHFTVSSSDMARTNQLPLLVW